MIYEYRCEKCQHLFEVWAKISDPAPEACPECQSPSLAKVISATAFALKGTGWYSTDYKSSSKETPKETKKEATGEACSPQGCSKPGCSQA